MSRAHPRLPVATAAFGLTLILVVPAAARDDAGAASATARDDAGAASAAAPQSATQPAPAASVPVRYVPPPGDTAWQRLAPEHVGLDAARLEAAIAFAIESESKLPRDLAVAHYLSWAREPYDAPAGRFAPRGDVTGLVVRFGVIAAEWGDPSRVDLTFSVAKSFLSTVVGLALDEARIKDVHDRVAPYMVGTPVADLFASPHNAKITWDHLLRQTSDWQGTLWGKPDWADRPQGDPLTWMNRPRHEPGTVYKYNDVRVNLLALAALHAWRQPLPEVLKARVMDPVGASNTWRWEGYENSWTEVEGRRVWSVSGGSHWGGGLFISAFDQARFGLLTLSRGWWGDRRVLSEAWVRMALTPTASEPTYGVMNWFLNTDRRLLPSAPASAFVHLGAGTNAIYVDPEHDLVVVVRWIDRSALDTFIGKVLASITTAPHAR